MEAMSTPLHGSATAAAMDNGNRDESMGQTHPRYPSPSPSSTPTPTPVPQSLAESPRPPLDWSPKRSAPKSPASAPHTSTHQNQVSHVMLHGILIVSLNIDGRERLCLAQISNTLLKDYSYNEIHNRRVALGITCVQCTPVQLEILRRAGAMPVASRRCGMITKREAERLVKSFLEDSEPPKLPEDFAFQVYHECGWGCHGFFEPARYNSSRAKCIKCGYCSVYFSPNKFIFHFHRTSDAKYHHPDAANFNSWRRHLKLVSSGKDDDMHLWEDVKAMFNGGTRKRIFSSSPRMGSKISSSESSTTSSVSSSEMKKKAPKLAHTPDLQLAPKHPFPTHTFNPYPWGYGPGTKPAYPFVSVNTSQSLCFGFPPPGGAKDNNVTSDGSGLLKNGMTPLPAPWLGRGALPYSNLDAFWDKAFGLPRPMGGGSGGGGGTSGNMLGPGNFRGGLYPPPLAKASSLLGERMRGGGGGNRGMGHMGESLASNESRMDEDCERRDHHSSLDLTRDSTASHLTGSHSHGHSNASGNNGGVYNDRLSAFRPVGKANNAQAYEDDQASTGSEAAPEDDDDNDETEEIDVMVEDVSCPEDLSQPELREANNRIEPVKRKLEDEGMEEGRDGDAEDAKGGDGKEGCDSDRDMQAGEGESPNKRHRPLDQGHTSDGPAHNATEFAEEDTDQHSNVEQAIEEEEHVEERPVTGADDSGLSDESDADGDAEDSSLLTMSKEELCHTLKKELCNRKKKEKEVSVLRETFQEEVTREKAFRDQMARQLEVLRETLTNELEQERKVRFSLQQKLKEAHDALHSFSCSMLTAARDPGGCGFKDTVLPR